MLRLPNWRDAYVRGVRVLLRVDFNVPVEGGKVTNDFRLRMTIPTLTELRVRGARLVVASHLGRPKGKRVKSLSLQPVAKALEELLDYPVKFVDDITGEQAYRLSLKLKDGEIMLLQNLRFDEGEERNDDEFARRLARLADTYINDAFGTLHRRHASVCAITKFLPSYAGPLVLKETEVLMRVRTEPDRPLAVVFGGAKVADKIALIRQFLKTADVLIVGGAMAYTFLAAKGVGVGRSRVKKEYLEEAKGTLEEARRIGRVLALPEDHIAASSFSADAEPVLCRREIPNNLLGLDIGPKTVDRFSSLLRGAKMVLWNGPMGVFEWERFSEGTAGIARAIGRLRAYSVICGGDTIAAVERYGNIDRFSYVSTGGGAALQFLQNPYLPGISALLERRNTE
ncbi:MAG: phosphoglycerate kinase [Planctomycetota bacterium]|nr:MAG: phosphoglycerate kinase [Planctomycetota bacterium]